jgi:hypothetical protein
MSYLDSKRIIGTNTQRVGADAISGGWKEIGRASVTSGDTINVTSLADKRYLMVLGCGIGSGNVALISRFNSDTGNNYNNRYSSNGGADATSGANDRLFTNGSGSSPQEFSVFHVANKSNKEKMLVGHNVNNATAGAGTAPQRREYANKWANTSSAISSLNVFNSDSGDFASGSEVVVLGYDPDDTHTDNFWELLDDSSWSSGDNWTSGTFTAKKYLWVQFYTEGGAGSSYFRFNGDSGNNYSNRYSINGGSDSTIASQPESYLGAIDGLSFHNLFIINNASNEKLFTHQRVSRSSAGAGTAPTRNEGAGKWANTSNQITSITVTTAGGGNLTAGNMKVWGSN